MNFSFKHAVFAPSMTRGPVLRLVSDEALIILRNIDLSK